MPMAHVGQLKTTASVASAPIPHAPAPTASILKMPQPAKDVDDDDEFDNDDDDDEAVLPAPVKQVTTQSVVSAVMLGTPQKPPKPTALSMRNSHYDVETFLTVFVSRTMPCSISLHACPR